MSSSYLINIHEAFYDVRFCCIFEILTLSSKLIMSVNDQTFSKWAQNIFLSSGKSLYISNVNILLKVFKFQYPCMLTAQTWYNK